MTAKGSNDNDRRTLRPADLLPLLLAALLLPAIQGCLHCFGFKRCYALLLRFGRIFSLLRCAELTVDQARRTAWLVHAVARRLLPTGDCLPRSLAVLLLLGHRHGGQLQLMIGISKTGGKVDAHAWVEFEGQPLNEAADVRQTFVAFANRQQVGSTDDHWATV